MSAYEVHAAGAPSPGALRSLPVAPDAAPADPTRTGTPLTASAVRTDFAEPMSDVEIPLQRAWRMAEALAAIGGGPRAERLIELANRPGPVPPGSLLEAIKRLGIAPSDARPSRAV
jgi:hypothetical protein